jgi:RNase P/RNase MRP subunit p29
MKFLTNLNLNLNELQNLVVHKLGTMPTGITGQVVFFTGNTGNGFTQNTLYLYNGTS